MTTKEQYTNRYLNATRSPMLSTHKILRHQIVNNTGWEDEQQIMTTLALWNVTRPYEARRNPNGDPMPQ